MNVLSNILSPQLMETLGWTLLHSLWQAVIIAAGFGLLMYLMRRSPARTRYAAGVGALALVAAVTVATFIGFYNLASAAAPALAGSETALSAGAIEGGETLSGLAVFKNYFSRHLPLVVTFWLVGVMVLMLRFAGGFLLNRRLLVHRTRPVPPAWQKRMEHLKEELKMDRAVRLLESALVKVPLAIGHFKPVVLFPLGMMTGLPGDQVEALLAHELAHIARRDYLVNMVQNLVDILFFYHPAVRWISAFVRAEREHCCDDAAVSLSGDSVVYARALTTVCDRAGVTGFGLSPVNAAVAAGRGQKGLLGRIRRIVHPGWSHDRIRMNSGFTGTGFMLACLLLMTVGMFAFTGTDKKPPKPPLPPKVSAVAPVAVPAPASAPAVETETAKVSVPVAPSPGTAPTRPDGKLSAPPEAPEPPNESVSLPEPPEAPSKEAVPQDEEKKKAEKKRKEELALIEKKMALKEEQYEKQRAEELGLKEEEYEKQKAEELALKEEQYERQRAEELAQKEKELDRKKIEMHRKQEQMERQKAEMKAGQAEKRHRQEEMTAKQEAMKARQLEMVEKEEEAIKLQKELAEHRAELEKHAQKEMIALEDELQERSRELSLKKTELEKIHRQKLEQLEKELQKNAREKGKNKDDLKKLRIVRTVALKAEMAKQKRKLEEEQAKLKVLARERLKGVQKELVERQKEVIRLKKVQKIVNHQLVKDGLVEKGEKVNFKLTPKALYVDGKKQPKKVFLKYCKILQKLEVGKGKPPSTIIFED